MEQYTVATVGALKPGEMKPVAAGAKKLVLFCNSDGTFSALEDRCSHAEVKLSRGKFCDGEVTCPAHGAKFDVKSGANLCMPAVKPVKSYAVEVQGDSVVVLLS